MDLFAGRRATWLLGAALVAPFVLLAFYAAPQGDDFARGEIALREGVYAELKFHYLYTDGRYSATVLQAVCGLVLEAAVAAGPFVFLAAWWLSCWRCLYVVTQSFQPSADQRWRLLQTGGLALLLLGLFLTRMPSPCQGFYWLNGAQTYTAPIVIGWLLIAELVRLFDPQTIRAKWLLWHSCAASLLAALLIGFSEIAMLLWDLALAVLTLVALATRRRPYSLAPILLSTAVASAAVVFSPSNAYRAKQYPHSHEVARSVGRAATHTLVKVGVWSLDPALWLGALLLVPAARRWPWPQSFDWMRRRWTVLAIAAATPMVLALATFPAYYGMGHAPPPRACNLLYLVFIAGWFAAMCVAARAYPSWSPARLRPQWVTLAIFLVGGWPLALWDDAVVAPKYGRELAARTQQVEAALSRGERTVELTTLRHRPRMLYFLDLTTHPSETDSWINDLYARRHGLEAVTVHDASNRERR